MVNRISLVVTTYNSHDFLPELMVGLGAYSQYLYEIIVIDDCSVDRTYEVMKSRSDCWSCNAKFAQTSENSGRPARPRNMGLELVSGAGDWVLFMDADDLMPLDYVSYLANVNLDQGAIYSLNRQKVARPVLASYGKQPKFLKIPTWFQKYKNVICFSGTLVSRSLAIKSTFPESYLEDWLYFKDLLSCSDLKILKTTNMSLQYRHSQSSLTPTKITQVKRIMGVHSTISVLLYFSITILLVTYEFLSVRLESQIVDTA